MPIYLYECSECGEFEVEQRIIEDALTRCVCGEPARRLIAPVAFLIPAYMKAPGSTGSSYDACERQAAYLKSDEHRVSRAQTERINERAYQIEERGKSYVAQKLRDPEYVKKTKEEIAARSA